MERLLIISFLVTLIGFTLAQIPAKFTAQNPCTTKSNCRECIETPSCAWCYDPNFGDRPRCFQPAYPAPQKDLCKEEYVHYPDNLIRIISNAHLSKAHSKASAGGAQMSGQGSGYEYNSSSSWSGSGSSGGGASSNASGAGQIVQVAPQRINLMLRAKQSYKISMHYTQAEDYPVDLYYLMDLSKSMSDDKEKLSLLGDKLARTMQNITSNFTLGFGSFVDKVVMPYVSTIPQNLKNPCQNEICEPPYGYRHIMQLSQNTFMFSKMVKQASVSGNLDAPEGGFDAIMQAVVCRTEIGWREKARRLLVFSTDASFHFAGDGKLGGIVKPNDGSCHMDDMGYYSESTFQDYPSVEQINLSVKNNAINVIFAVTASTYSVYEQLTKHIEGSSVAKLSTDSSNIVELIKGQYEQISSFVEMKHNASGAVSIKFYSSCLNGTGAPINTNKCGNIKVGDIIKFIIELEVLRCPKDPREWFQTIQIYPVGINESLIIDLEMLCSCACEKPGDKYYEEHSRKCSHHGTYKCGICECDYGAFGPNCECTADQKEELNRTLGCIDPKSLNGLECNGKGQCVCGRCDCEQRVNENERIYGPYCECDNFSCERHDGELCSGKQHGTCDCGLCVCKEGWSGSNCGCKVSNATCYQPDVENAEICSGHGVCECGVCKCETTAEGRYSGKQCENCPTCSDKCLEFKDCVQCQMYKTGKLKKDVDCAANCTKFVPISVPEVEATKESEYLCAYYDENECRFAYVYYFDDAGKVVIRAQEEPECPPKVYLPGIVLGVIAAIVLIGMAMLLLWKLLTTIHDRREFAKFEKERMMAKWDTGENPIYKQATSTFKNPTYAGKG